MSDAGRQKPTKQTSVFRLLTLAGKGCVGGARVTRPDIRAAWLSCKSPAQVAPHRFLRKEVIQPQVPLRLPCYDFTPVADLTVVGCLPEG